MSKIFVNIMDIIIFSNLSFCIQNTQQARFKNIYLCYIRFNNLHDSGHKQILYVYVIQFLKARRLISLQVLVCISVSNTANENFTLRIFFGFD
jgi:uncharacterized membrane protein